MSTLDGFTLDFEDIPRTARKGGKDSKMSKNSTTQEAGKPVKKYQKSRGEHAKDIMIAVLVTAVIGFVAGMHFANKHNAEVNSAVKAAQVTADQTAVKK